MEKRRYYKNRRQALKSIATDVLQRLFESKGAQDLLNPEEDHKTEINGK